MRKRVSRIVVGLMMSLALAVGGTVAVSVAQPEPASAHTYNWLGTNHSSQCNIVVARKAGGVKYIMQPGDHKYNIEWVYIPSRCRAVIYQAPYFWPDDVPGRTWFKLRPLAPQVLVRTWRK